MSNLINKVKSAVNSHGDSNTSTSTNAGPHNSNIANKADPRFDSDMDNRNNPTSHAGGLGNTQHGAAGPGSAGVGGAGYGTGAPTTHAGGAGYGSGAPTTHAGGVGHNTAGSTNAGPHNSNLLNKADPRVDSDRDGRNNPASHAGGYGNTQYDNTGAGGAGYGTQTSHAGGVGHNTAGSTNAGPHNSNLLNKADPRVDSDRDGRNNPASHAGGYGNTQYDNTTGGAGYGTGPSATHTGGHATHAGGVGQSTHGSTNAGPHNSNLMNKADPRVDSDRDGRNNPASHAGGYGNTQGAPAHSATTTGGQDYYGQQPMGSSATPGSGNTAQTAGPHNSNLMNKIDPRVDSDLDGSKTYGGNATHR